MKNQVSIEYLGTFGWILLVVLVTILTLSYYGVFDISNQLPEDCYFGEQIECSNQFVDEQGNLVLSLESKLNKEININNIRVEGYEIDINDCSSTTLKPNNLVNIICKLNPDNPGTVFDEERQKFLVKLTIQPEGSSDQYDLEGTVFTDVLETDLTVAFNCVDIVGPSGEICEKEYQCNTWDGSATISNEFLGEGYCCSDACTVNYCEDQGDECCSQCVTGTRILGEQFTKSCQETVGAGSICCGACRSEEEGGGPTPT